MNITKQFIKSLKEVENEMPMPKNTSVENKVFAISGTFFVLGIIVSNDLIVFPVELGVCKSTVSSVFIFIALVFMLIYFAIRQKAFQPFSCTALEIKELERKLKNDGLNLEKCHQKIKCDIEQKRDAWREKFDALFHVATKGISFFVLTPMGFMFTLLFNTAYKGAAFENASELDAEIKSIVSLCIMLLGIVLVALLAYALVIFRIIPQLEKCLYGRYLSFLEDVEIYYSEAKADNKEE